jgi:WD40 repeat protein
MINIFDGCFTLHGHSNYVLSLAFLPDGKYLATGSFKTVKLWSVKSQKEVTTLLGHGDYVLSVEFSLDGNYLASGSRDKTVKLWSMLGFQQTEDSQL